jgi:hypothetical protein
VRKIQHQLFMGSQRDMQFSDRAHIPVRDGTLAGWFAHAPVVVLVWVVIGGIATVGLTYIFGRRLSN